MIESATVVSQELARPSKTDSEMNEDNKVRLFPNDGNNSARSLQQNSSSFLRLMIEVNGKVSPYDLPEDFSFSSIVVNSLVANALSYNKALSKASTFFASLGESSIDSD
eukprot:9589379-Ditylum_brightwellii.AAC.1